jgi:hypothetical protein
MVHVVEIEMLPEEREKKYHADNYKCCPPPMFVILVTIVEVSAQKNQKILFSVLHNLSETEIRLYILA